MQQMKRFMTKKVAVIGVVATLLVGGGVAFAIAQGSASGSGSGSTTAGVAGPCPVTLSVTFDPGPAITPGGTALIDFDAKNTGSAACLVKTISATTFSGIGPVSSANTACQNVIDQLQSQFWLTPSPSGALTNTPVPQNGTTGVLIQPGVGDVALPGEGLLHWANTSFDQSNCLGAPLTLAVQTP
jgi:hypothetical protein